MCFYDNRINGVDLTPVKHIEAQVSINSKVVVLFCLYVTRALFYVPFILCEDSLFGPRFVMHCLVLLLVLQLSRLVKERAGWFILIPFLMLTRLF